MDSAIRPNVVTNFAKLDLKGSYRYADYLTWRFSERVELIKGRLLRMHPAPNVVHQRVAQALNFRLLSFFQHRAGQVFVAPLEVRLPIPDPRGRGATVVQPDLCVLCDAGKLDEQGPYRNLAPAIAEDHISPIPFPELVIDLPEVLG